jgi:hypothetical protein
MLYNQRKATQGGDRKSKGKNCTLNDTAQQVAAETGVSPRTVKSAGKLAAKVEEIQQAEPELPRQEVITKAKETAREDLGWLDDRGFGQREDLGGGGFGYPNFQEGGADFN